MKSLYSLQSLLSLMSRSETNVVPSEMVLILPTQVSGSIRAACIAVIR